MYRWTGEREDALPVMPAHRVWTFEQQNCGRMLATGTTPDYSLGIQLFNAESLEQVEELCQNEPLVMAGHRTFEVISWKVHALFGFALPREAPPAASPPPETPLTQGPTGH
jgi:uncharacterized protein YciI